MTIVYCSSCKWSAHRRIGKDGQCEDLTCGVHTRITLPSGAVQGHPTFTVTEKDHRGISSSYYPDGSVDILRKKIAQNLGMWDRIFFALRLTSVDFWMAECCLNYECDCEFYEVEEPDPKQAAKPTPEEKRGSKARKGKGRKQ